MAFSRQEYWSELPFLSPGDLPGPGIEPCSPAVQEMLVGSLGREDPLEEAMVTHSSILAWRIPGQRSLVGPAHGVAKSQTRLKRLSTRTCSGRNSE